MGLESVALPDEEVPHDDDAVPPLSQLLHPLPQPETLASFGLILPSGLRHFCGM